MPLDALCLAAICDELSSQVTGSKIDKIGQPEKDVLIFTLRGKGIPQSRLLISAGSGDARIHLTAHQFENPTAPPMFCMLMRKHLQNARIENIKQLPGERVVEIILSAADGVGVISEKRLIIELIGSVSNIILTTGEGLIIDCLRRISFDKNGKRAVLPGLIYEYPTPQADKINPLQEKDIRQMVLSRISLPNNGLTVEKWLLSNFIGMSPLICREISWRAYGAADFRMTDITDDFNMLCCELSSIVNAVNCKNYKACMLIDKLNNTPRDYSFVEIKQYEDALNLEIFNDFSSMLDAYYTRKAKANNIKQRLVDITKAVKNAHARLIRKLVAQKSDLKNAVDREYLRQCGDIIMANIYNMKKGQKELVAQDFYATEGSKRKIVLDPLKSPGQNAEQYYKRYTKAKNAEKYLNEQIRRGERELEYLESVLNMMEYTESEVDIQDIRNELISAGYLRAPKVGKAGRVKQKVSAPMKFMSSTGKLILAGKNNIQNDQLTLRTAGKSDMWLHAQKIHGSHVVISSTESEVDETTIFEAATIAAYYSSARASGKVPIDYTLVRHVKKPSGGRPGMVIYNNFKTITVTPDEKLVNKLRS